MNTRGQASILIAIIFQVLFIFFAMVINVGLLVHDKINLQNSVDIAAYYGAMKQAEVLNVMGHVNYQIHSTYKLFNFRLWSLGNSGRSGWFFGNQDMSDHAANWDEVGGVDAPIVCMAHKIWYDWSVLNKKEENLCKKPDQYVPPITPISLTGFQPAFAGFLSVFANQSSTNASLFQADFADGGKANYALSLRMLSSYKISAGKKRAAMQSLQKLLTGVGQGSQQQSCQVSASDFCDVSGSSVRSMVENIINKNLTAANLKGLSEIQFANPLFQKPFLVPVEVRVFMKYEDLNGIGGSGNGTPRDINTIPAEGLPTGTTSGLAELFYGPDYEGKYPAASATEFAGESDPLHNFNSLIGFEKDPWTLAYVRVSATTTPKMLFSPFTTGDKGTVTLQAEAYAMPFGGRLGPWYYDGWSAGAPSSNSSTKVDTLLPPRYPDAVSDASAVPNFSRYPGDQLGMKSALAENVAIPMWISEPPQFAKDNYNDLDTDPNNVNQNEIVPDNARGDSSLVSQAETSSIAPNLFDVLYFAVDGTFDADYHQNIFGGNTLFSQICGGHCEDLGSGTSGANGGAPAVTSVAGHMTTGLKDFAQEWWLIHNPGELNASWTQEGTDTYVGTYKNVAQIKKLGGRTGYSVKIVSKEFLNSGQLPFGGSSGAGPLNNSPTAVLGE